MMQSIRNALSIVPFDAHSYNTVRCIKSCSIAKNHRDFIGNAMQLQPVSLSLQPQFWAWASHENRVKCSGFMIKIFGQFSARASTRIDQQRTRHEKKRTINAFSARMNCRKLLELMDLAVKSLLNCHRTTHKLTFFLPFIGWFAY